MKIAHNDGKLISAFLTAQAEAEAAFGNRSVYIEKYIREPRHIEVQILADGQGNVIHLGERDCSIQRRHQKLLEESPAPGLSEKLRRRIAETAIKVAKAVQYENAGTVEFLLDSDENFYFMEMNTRLQVEHPVTEVVTGIDLVKAQIRIAVGEKLKWSQSDIKSEGHGMECRINAEDPDRDFLPCPGKVETLIWPGGPGVRVDSHIYPGYKIPPYYDSMVAKIIVHAPSRPEAIILMQRAIKETVIGPIKTTLPLHEKILIRPRFREGKVSTNFIDTQFTTSKIGALEEIDEGH
jgi:acetyl-CoA carboxylase biotin carboxylase subunit